VVKNEVCYHVQDRDVCWGLVKAVIIFRSILTISGTIRLARKALLLVR